MSTSTAKTAPLGNTGLEITRVGFGAWAIGGGGWEFGWGPQDDEVSVAAIHHALDRGINWIDTAAAYGFGRDSVSTRSTCTRSTGPSRTRTSRRAGRAWPN